MKLTLSNSLIIIPIIFTLVSFGNNEILIFGMNNYFLNQNNYSYVLLQFFLYSFLHGNIMHLLFNSLFIGYFGNKVEENIGFNKYLIFFILTTIFIGITLLLLTNGNTIGISGFGLALLSYYTLTLYENNNSEYKGGVTAIIINILIGFGSGISLIGHLFGAIFGIIYFYILRLIK